MTATESPAPSVASDARGILSLEIADHKGEVHSYAVEPASPGLDAWAVYLTRLDTGARHRVAVDGRGKWRCGCLDALYRVPGKKRACKHILPVRSLKALAELILKGT